ncbi:MAG: homoserine O-succinyltransferase [Steroidobacterales bacterium]
MSPQHTNLIGADPAIASAEAAQGVLQLPGRLSLHHGGSLDQPSLGWRLSGKPGAPVIVALGGISAHRRVFDAEQPRAGWWCEIAGAGRALDSTRVRVLGIDYLGGSGESTAPSPGGGVFPSLSSYDQAEALRQLLDHLRIPRLRAIVGASYGGMVALAFGERFADRVDQLLVISAADRAHPMATAWRSVQRRTVRFALSLGHAAEGMELARALAMATYRSPEEFAARFSHLPRSIDGRFVFPVEEYLFARGRDYAARYRAESFLCLSESIDLHVVDATRVATPTTVVAVREDQLVPIGDMRALASRLPRARLHEMSSPHGHDAFLKEAGALQAVFESLYGVALK